MEDEELVKMFNPTLKRRETILFILIMVINGLLWIELNIGLDMCARKRWRVDVSKMEMMLYPGRDKSEKVCMSYNV